ncbi:MAG: DNA polymerase Y family protein [Verrucomicrobiota bacterium]
MFAVIEIPDFPLQALLRMRPHLRSEPVGILRGEGRRAVVAHVNQHAGVIRPGTSAARALAECHGLQLLSPSPDAEREAAALLLTAAWTLSPRVEPTAPGRCMVDLSGADLSQLAVNLSKLRSGLVQHDLNARIGAGPTALVARYASHVANPILVVDDPGGFLAELPVQMLDLAPDEERLFSDLGLKTLGSITAFPRSALAGRLGSRGDELWSRAAGEWIAPIQAVPFPVRHIATMELEDPVETLEPLLFTLRRFCERLASEVGQFGGGTNRLSLVLALGTDAAHRRDFDLPEPTANAEVLFAVLENHLSALQTDAAIVGVSLEAFPARRLEQQEGLLDTGLKDAPMFYATLGRLAAVVGVEQVGTPRRGNSHRSDDVMLDPPQAMIPERRAPDAPEQHGPLLWRLRPPVVATVELTDAQPTFLNSTIASGAVTVCRRPFRANGEWWSAETWAREEWDVQVGTGLYRLLHTPRGWFLDGLYD